MPSNLPSKGSVTLKVKVLNRKGNNVQLGFSVVDTGIGIAKENIDKIFETFEQADDQTAINLVEPDWVYLL